MARKVAVMDIGSNSSRLDLFDVCGGSSYDHVDFARVPTKLVSYVGEDNFLGGEGARLACSSLASLARHARSHGPVDEWHVFATASLRGRTNEAAVVARIKETTGFDVEVVVGEQEAAFGFASLQRRFNPACAVMADVGGGSTEVVVADGGEVVALDSLPLGSRALSKRFINGEWPQSGEVECLRASVVSELERYDGLELSAAPVLFGIGGTARALQAIAGSDKPCFGEDTRREVERACPERLDTMAAGMLIFEGLWNVFDPQLFIASDANPREGYLIKRVLGL